MEGSPLLWNELIVICLITGEYVHSGNARRVECNASDREALLNLKNGLEDPDKRLSSWKGSNCCRWMGISCDNTTGAVVAVDLHNPYPSSYDSSGNVVLYGNLGGEIRPSLTKLKSLRHLDLSLNTFNGTIPDFLPSLKNLQYLNLSQSGFTGAIPPKFGNFSCLQSLDVSRSDFNADNLEWVANLVSLEYLVMSDVDLSMVGARWIEALNKLPLLTEMHLDFCELSGFTYSLPIVNFTSLAVMNLHDNFFFSIPNWITNISSLEIVDLSNSGLQGRIPLGFSELPNLKKLALYYNNLLTASCSQLFSGSWKKIEVLSLNVNKLHGRLPASLGNMTSLVLLTLRQNNITGGIPISIGKLSNLQFIDLSENYLAEGFPEHLEEIENCNCTSPLPSLQNFLSSYSGLGGVGNIFLWANINYGLVLIIY